MANLQIDDRTKQQAEELFNRLGLTVDVAVNIFLTQSIREQAIPFSLKLTDNEIFYSKTNVDHILRGVRQFEENRGQIHELIEVD